MKITSWKREAVEILLLRTPEAIFANFLKHYREYTWERCCMNVEMLRMRCWASGYVYPSAAGGKVSCSLKQP